MTDARDIIYRVNDRDEVVFVNEAWDQFAAANAGETTGSAQVFHRPLWDFIIDSTTRELYRQLLERIRAGRALRFTFRCDSPTCRRLLEMHVYRAEDGAVEFRTHTLREEVRQPPPLLASHSARSQQLLRACGWCNKVHHGGAWAEVEEAVAALRLFEDSLVPSLTHGICEDCYKKIIETLDHSSGDRRGQVKGPG